MDVLFAKLTNLGYEFFGIVLPGVVCWILLGLWWAGLGPVAAYWTCGAVPVFDLAELRAGIEGLSTALVIAGALPALVSIYFLGHVLHWAARSDWLAKAGKPMGADKGSLARVGRSLIFSIPKPTESFDPKLKPMFEVVCSRFAAAGSLEWGQIFPVLKSFLLSNLNYSLVATYQNKYTLHRSVTAGAAAWFWLNLLTIPIALIGRAVGGPSAHWVALAMCLGAALVLVWGFSDSFVFHWKNFGNSIITESYSVLAGPSHEKSR